MNLDIETHTDGTLWMECKLIKKNFTFIQLPKNLKSFTVEGNEINIYHPNYIEINGDGSDSEYQCKDCGKTWWVERDG